MKRARKSRQAKLVALLASIMICVSSWAFAQGGGVNYFVPTSMLGYNDTKALEAYELAATSPRETIDIAMDEKVQRREKPTALTADRAWGTGIGKSYLIPALEIPAFLLLLNGYDRLAYPDLKEPDGKKTYSTTPSTA